MLVVEQMTGARDVPIGTRCIFWMRSPNCHMPPEWESFIPAREQHRSAMRLRVQASVCFPRYPLPAIQFLYGRVRTPSGRAGFFVSRPLPRPRPPLRHCHSTSFVRDVTDFWLRTLENSGRKNVSVCRALNKI